MAVLCVLAKNFKIKLKRKGSSQLVLFHQCDHEVQEVQWVQEVHSCHLYQKNRQLQQVPIITYSQKMREHLYDISIYYRCKVKY